MVEIDPVVLELRAEVGKYRADLKSTTSLVSQSLGQQEKSVQRLEAQMRRSSGAIGGQIKGLAAAFAGAFTGRELVGLIDGFTRLQNSLRVAGLEGQNLERVQSQLLELSSKYGVGIEGLADLFGKTSQTANELGASQQQLIQLTEASSQALKITGTSAQQAQGALLGLTQALASGKVRAEEFNQINEGGLRPLLQVIANTERFGGSVAKLRQAVNDGKVSSQEFFQAILGGAQELDAKASKATLTLSGAFEALNSRLTVYVGSASSAQGVTGALAAAISSLADNIDVAIQILSAIIVAIGVKYVAAAARAAAANIALAASSTGSATAMGVMGAATFAAQARLAGAATSMEAAAFAAKGLGGRLLALAGGPYGALLALSAGLAYVIVNTNDAADASAQYKRQQDALTEIQNRATDATDRLATATGKARTEALANAKALREETKQYLANAQAALIAAEAKAVQAREDARQANQRAQADFGEIGRGRISPNREEANKKRRDAIQAQADVDAAEKNVIRAQTEVNRITKSIEAAAPPKISTDKPKKPKKGPKDRTDELAARAAQELFNLEIEELRARAALTTNAEDRADLERQILGKERDAREADIAAAIKSGDLTAKQAEEQRQILDLLYGKRNSEAKDGEILVESTKSLYGIAIERERQRQAEQDAADLADATFRAQSDALRDQYDLARSQAERRDLALKIVAAEYDHLQSVQEAIIASETATKAEKKRAEIILASLPSSRAAATQRAQKDTQGPLEQYFDRARLDAQQLNEAYQQVAVDGLQAFNDGLTDAIVNSKNLGDVFKNVAKQIIADLIRIAIQQQIVAAFGGGSGGGDGGLFSAIGSIFGRASGGYVAPGQVVRVNESRGGAEYLRMGSQGGTVIPLGQVNQQVAQPSSGTGTVRVIIEEGPNFMSTIRTEATGVSLEVTRASAPTLIDAAANETLRRANRPKV